MSETALAKARDAKQRKTVEKRQEKIAAILRDSERCYCGIYPGISDEELRDMGAGCTHPRWVCPTLDAVRRAVG